VTAFVPIFQYLLVFLIPLLFGWVVMRRVVSEHDLPTLAAGSAILGLVALMVSVNELRYWLEFGPAVWFAYKLLLASSLALLVMMPPVRWAPGWRRTMRAPWKIALVLAGALFIVVYFGIPARAGVLNDAWWGHLPIATQIQTAAHFPLQHPLAVDDPLYYHFGPDILAATWSYLLDLPVATGFAINIVLLAPATFLAAFAIGLRVSRSFWSATMAGALVVIGGNLRFLNLAGASLEHAANRLQVFNSQTIQGLLQMVFTPSHAAGIPITLVALLLLRTLLTRPSWPLAAVLAGLLGALALVAEWYFLPMLATVGICFVHYLVRCRAWHPSRRRLEQFAAVLFFAAAYGAYSNSYVSGMISHYWMRQPAFEEKAHVRRLEHLMLAMPGAEETRRAGLAGSQELEAAALAEANWSSSAAGETKWSPPDLVPLRLNFAHLGQAPSWENAGSNESTWVPLWSWSFVSECLPVLGLGLPFGFWLWRRRRDPLLFALIALTVLCSIPPVFLDWGYRSSDFLRFFTGAFSFAAVLMGLMIGHLLGAARRGLRLLGGTLACGALANAVGLGVLGLMPSTLATVMDVSSKGTSLSQASGAASAPARPATAAQPDHDAAFRQLARSLDRFLFPLAQGRDRVLVIVPPGELPPLRVFPEWIKLSTLSRVLLPVGWYWNDSGYAYYYRRAVLNLDEQAVASLGARWVVVTNLWGYTPPPAVAQALAERERFMRAASFRAGPYEMSVYRVY
jgi:hypothetical protein